LTVGFQCLSKEQGRDVESLQQEYFNGQEGCSCKRTCALPRRSRFIPIANLTRRQESTDEGNDSPGDGKAADKFEEMQSELARPVRTMRTGPGRKTREKKGEQGGEKKKPTKTMTKWENSKLSKKEIDDLDRSKEVCRRGLQH
jgi:hypothetical protein